jgi:hypothetical protein
MVLAIMQLVSTLAPPAIELAHKLIVSFESSGLPPEDQLKMLNDLADSLKPMELKP